jgi:hypothetical protein
LDAIQKQYRDQLTALEYDDMMYRNRQSSSSSLASAHQDSSNNLPSMLHMTMDDNPISPPVRNKFAFPGTPPARPNSTPPGRNVYDDMDRQTEMLMNQFGGFGLNDEVSTWLLDSSCLLISFRRNIMQPHRMPNICNKCNKLHVFNR